MAVKDPHQRPARPGELCACGDPAKTVLIRELGEVPTCVKPEDYANLTHSIRIARATLPRSVRWS
jgi:hypothetical protein